MPHLNNSAVLIDIDAIKSAKAVMNQKFARIIEYYYEDTQVYINTMIEGFAKKDAAMIVPAAHTIKSSSRQLGAVAMADAALEMETAAKQVVKQEKTFAELVDKTAFFQELFNSTKLQMQVYITEALQK